MAQEQFDPIMSLCLQSRVAEALPMARALKPGRLSLKQKIVHAAFLRRFSVPTPAIGANRLKAIPKVISIYEVYWHSALLFPKNRVRAEAQLGRDLRKWMFEYRLVRLKTRSLEKTVIRLKREIESLGYYVITGTVAPLQELEIWAVERTINYNVALPEGQENVKTIIMSKFLTKGWVAYATQNLFYPGGWAAKEALYCNSNAYNLQSEKFRVSYLAHEAQHYSDYKTFPNLDSIDLEYRAKLAEFALANRTAKKMFQVFTSRADYNRESPHAFSYHCVLRDLTKRLYGHEDFHKVSHEISRVKVSELNFAAVQLLQYHSSLLRRKGRTKVRRLIS